MPDATDRSEARRDDETAEGEPIAHVLGDLRDRLRASRPLASGDDPISNQWRILRAAAGERGRLFEHRPSQWVDAREGSEHRCRFLPDPQRFEKLTKQDAAGWWVDISDRLHLLPATPIQYLERLDLANVVFGDDIRFVGVDVPRDRPHSHMIRTTQPFVEGDAPAVPEILAWLKDAGFEREADAQIGAYNAMCFRRDDLWLFDVRPANLVLCDDEIYAVDIIVQRTPSQS